MRYFSQFPSNIIEGFFSRPLPGLNKLRVFRTVSVVRQSVAAGQSTYWDCWTVLRIGRQGL